MPSSQQQSRCPSQNADTLIRKRSQVQVLVPPPASIPGQPTYGSPHWDSPRSSSLPSCPLRACEYELADTGLVLGRVLPGLVLVASGDSLRA
jgi:hypothetical protein